MNGHGYVPIEKDTKSKGMGHFLSLFTPAIKMSQRSLIQEQHYILTSNLQIGGVPEASRYRHTSDLFCSVIWWSTG